MTSHAFVRLPLLEIYFWCGHHVSSNIPLSYFSFNNFKRIPRYNKEILIIGYMFLVFVLKKKRRNRSKKPKSSTLSQSDNQNSEQIENILNSGKPKKRRKKKKANPNTEKETEKVDNLMSITFQDRRVSLEKESESQSNNQNYIDNMADKKNVKQKFKRSVNNEDIRGPASTVSKTKKDVEHTKQTKSISTFIKHEESFLDEEINQKSCTVEGAKTRKQYALSERGPRVGKHVSTELAKSETDKNIQKAVNKKPARPSTSRLETQTSDKITTKTKIQQQQSYKTEFVYNVMKMPDDDLIFKRREKVREQVLAERQAKKRAKKGLTSKTGVEVCQEELQKSSTTDQVNVDVDVNLPVVSQDKSEDLQPKAKTTKAERRALQEAQRQAKAEKQQQAKVEKERQDQKPLDTGLKRTSPSKPLDKVAVKSTLRKGSCKVKLFNHLYATVREQQVVINNPIIHPSVVRLGEQYAKKTVAGSNARCIAFLDALKSLIHDFELLSKKNFCRALEINIKESVDYLQKCRPLPVSVLNAYKYIKFVLSQLTDSQSESELKEHLISCIDVYIKDQIEKATQAINSAVQEKISGGDVVLTYGCSSLISYILEKAHNRDADFRVICVDSRPYKEGQEMLRRLVSKGIKCTSVLINAVSFVMPQVTKVLLGAHSILANGYVMSRTGTAQISLIAKSFNVPVLVCCETHKFSERVQTDAIVHNELGDPDDLVRTSHVSSVKNWRSANKLSPLNLNYDITPPELVTAVVTEVAILPCTSIPVILRMKPGEIY